MFKIMLTKTFEREIVRAKAAGYTEGFCNTMQMIKDVLEKGKIYMKPVTLVGGDQEINYCIFFGNEFGLKVISKDSDKGK